MSTVQLIILIAC